MAESQIKTYLSKFSNNSEDYFKSWPAKQYFDDESGIIAYGEAHDVRVIVADPICNDMPSRINLLNTFMSQSHLDKKLVVACDIPESSTGIYTSNSLEVMQIGATAIIDVQKCVQSTLHSKNFRNVRNRFNKNSYSSEFFEPPHSPELLNELRAVSDSWLSLPGREERTFLLGYFDDSYLQDCRIFAVKNQSGHIEAFVNIVPVYRPDLDVTIDLMRHKTNASHQVMDYLFLELIEYLASIGQKHFDLGLAPFSHIDHPNNIPEHAVKILHALHAPWFDYAGLEQFKNKFDPEWKPVYFAWSGNLLDFPRIEQALNQLITYKL